MKDKCFIDTNILIYSFNRFVRCTLVLISIINRCKCGNAGSMVSMIR